MIKIVDRSRRVVLAPAIAATVASVAMIVITAIPSSAATTQNGAPSVGTDSAVTAADCGAAGAGGAISAAPYATCPHGTIKANDLLFIGDSFLALSGAIRRDIEVHARAISALGANESYRDASQSGALIAGISQQYSSQASRMPVKVVIMDGIGNDMLGAMSCGTPGPNCAAITNAMNTTKNLFAKFASDSNLQNIVYMWYPKPPIAGLSTAEDYVAPQIQAMCTSSKVPCSWVDLRPVFQGHSNYIMSDGLHPTTAGSQAAADAVWATMQKNCIAQ